MHGRVRKKVTDADLSSTLEVHRRYHTAAPSSVLAEGMSRMVGTAHFSAAAEAGERYSALFSKITDEESLAALQTKQINATRTIREAAARLHSFNDRSGAALVSAKSDFTECMSILTSMSKELSDIRIRSASLVERLEARRNLESHDQDKENGE